mmetsp:Transcript_2474/g.5380  ORF Transcript_2474/g.5380 Transcript_2474/m.5380 type:complete len:224 (-) Transcript_2474:158-829(-)
MDDQNKRTTFLLELLHHLRCVSSYAIDFDNDVTRLHCEVWRALVPLLHKSTGDARHLDVATVLAASQSETKAFARLLVYDNSRVANSGSQGLLSGEPLQVKEVRLQPKTPEGGLLASVCVEQVVQPTGLRMQHAITFVAAEPPCIQRLDGTPRGPHPCKHLHLAAEDALLALFAKFYAVFLAPISFKLHCIIILIFWIAIWKVQWSCSARACTTHEWLWNQQS